MKNRWTSSPSKNHSWKKNEDKGRTKLFVEEDKFDDVVKKVKFYL